MTRAIATRLYALAAAGALIAGTFAGTAALGLAAPAHAHAAAPSLDQRKIVCHHLDAGDFWVVTGIWSDYGGDYCHEH
jgi:hypothetical protein